MILKVKAWDYQTAKDIIEANGVPHAEVDVILLNKISVKFDQRVRDGDSLEIYPLNSIIKNTVLQHLLPFPLKTPEFLLDENLGKLTRLLRMCGINSTLFSGKTDRDLVSIAIHEKRIILTRDIGLLKHRLVKRGYWVRNENPDHQLSEVYARYLSATDIRPFHRCLECNGVIRRVDKKNILTKIPSRTRQYFNEFFRCTRCGKIYWKGGHWERMSEKIQKLVCR